MNTAAMPCQRRQLAGLLPLIAIFLIAGCATVTSQNSNSDPQNSRTSPWTGRLAIRVEDQPSQSYTTAFALSGTARAGRLQLFSPLGGVMAQLEWQPGLAQLHNGGNTQQFTSLEDLVQAATGTALPVAALFDWLAGIPTAVDGWELDLSRHAQGRYLARRLSEPRAELRVILDLDP